MVADVFGVDPRELELPAGDGGLSTEEDVGALVEVGDRVFVAEGLELGGQVEDGDFEGTVEVGEQGAGLAADFACYSDLLECFEGVAVVSNVLLVDGGEDDVVFRVGESHGGVTKEGEVAVDRAGEAVVFGESYDVSEAEVLAVLLRENGVIEGFVEFQVGAGKYGARGGDHGDGSAEGIDNEEFCA